MLSATFVMPMARAEENTPETDENTAPYEVLYDLDYEEHDQDAWAYADGGQEGKREFTDTEGFSGSTSIKLGTKTGNDIYAGFKPYRGWIDENSNIDLTDGNTYVMSFKVKKISSDYSAGFSGIRTKSSYEEDDKIKYTDNWVWGLGEKFKPDSNGWKSVSYTFTKGESFDSANKILNQVPTFMYTSDAKDDYFLLIDDFRTVQINDTSILATDPTVELEKLSPEEIKVNFSQEMSDDVENVKAYTINGSVPQSVTYDAETKTATLVPAQTLSYGDTVKVMASACDYIGRAVYNTFEEKLAKELNMTSTTLPDNNGKENVGRNNYTMTFDGEIASAEVKLNGTAVSENQVSVSGNTVSFEVLINSAGEKTVSVTVSGTEGGEATVERTFTVNNNWVGFTDFENRWNQSNFSEKTWAYLNNTNNVELVGTQTHSGSYALHTTAQSNGNASLVLGTNGWIYWKDNSLTGLTVGKTYKYSYWVYADENATATTPNVLVANDSGSHDWILSNSSYSSLPKQQWNYFEITFTAVKTSLPFFYNIPANLYIDDIRLEEVPTAEFVSTTLPAEGTNAELGYNTYSMTFTTDIASAKVTYNGKTTDAAVSSADAKTINFGLAAIMDGDVKIVVTNTDGVTSAVTKTITVPDTLVAYTGFDKNVQWMQNYLYNNIWNGPIVTEGYNSPNQAAKLVTTDQWGAAVGLCEWEGSYVDWGSKSTMEGEGTSAKRYIETGKWYRVSFYAKNAEAGKNTSLGVARRNASGAGEGVAMFDLTDEMKKYTVAFKSISTQMPFLYRESMPAEIIIDDILIEQIESPYDYTYNFNAATVTADKSISVTLSNEKLTTPMNGFASIALYKDGVLQECHITNVSNLAIGSTVTTSAVTVPSSLDDGVYTVKAFLWDTDMNPICAAKTISEKTN